MSPAVQFFVQFALVLTAILIGIRRGGVALGLIGGLGVAILVGVFRDAPGTPPIDVMLIILAVVTASATLHVAGGLDFLVQKTEKVLRAHPKQVTILAPLATFFLTVAVGTGHAVYALLPVISDVALKTGIRPERPMAASSVASQMGITASPVAAALTTFIALAPKDANIGIPQILMVTLPALLIGVFAMAAYSYNRGKELSEDPEYQERLKDPEFVSHLAADYTTLDKVITTKAKVSVALFFLGVLSVITVSLVQWLWPSIEIFPKVKSGEKLSAIPMTTVVQFLMLAAGALILFYCNVKAKDIVKSPVFIAGMTAVVSIFGIAWMSETFITANQAFLVEKISDMVKFAPWTFAIAIFCVSALVKSQAAVLAIMLPLGYKLGLSPYTLIGMMPAAYAYFFFAFYPSDLAAIQMDRTGTTRIGKYLLNHSFMLPGLIGVGVATVAAMGIAKLAFG